MSSSNIVASANGNGGHVAREGSSSAVKAATAETMTKGLVSVITAGNASTLNDHLNGPTEGDLNGNVNSKIDEGASDRLDADPNCNLHTQTDESVSMTDVEPLRMPIAICGIGIRLPGGLRRPSELFDLLVEKKDAKTTVPKKRFKVDACYNPSNKAGGLATPYAYFIDEDLSQFDTSMFGMSNAQVASADPSQRLLLEVTREALENAGEAHFRGKDIGTFFSDFTTRWEDVQDMDVQRTAYHKVTSKTDFVPKNRLAFEYDLLGPSMLVKTACSATGGALHSAVLAIRSGSCSSAIVAEANLILTPPTSIEMSAQGILASDGDSKTFDAKPDGFARGESVCALYVKPLRDAVRDGNPIRAIIRACACDSNADGGDGSRTFGTPDALAQEALIRQTYAAAGLPLAETKVVELHGIGTHVGDPLETAAIAQCFDGEDEVYIGSVKPNIGDGGGASTMASIIKATLALESRTVLPNIKFNHPNPKILWDRNLAVPIEPQSWPVGVRERISINSFGLGGSNMHIVLDSASSLGVKIQHRQAQLKGGIQSRGKRLLLLSGNSEPSIARMAKAYRKYLDRHPQNLEAMVYTLAWRRERLKLGSYCIVDAPCVSEAATPVSSKNMHRVAFVFTGHGTEWVGMGREMIEENEYFAASIRRMDDVLRAIEHPPSWNLKDLLLSDKADEDLFTSTDISQPVSTAIQIAYVDTLAAWGLTPAAIIGHSSGEFVAAYAAGALTSREAIITSYYRGYACAQNKLSGGMAAIGMGREEVGPYLQPGVVLACDNSNANVTISGDLIGLQSTIANIKQNRQMFVRQLRVPMAYHSSHMSTVAELYHSLIAHHLSPQAPKIPWYSTVYGRKVTAAKVAGPQYFIHGMERPALFRTAALQLLEDFGADMVHLEIGPHSTLAGPLRQIYQESGFTPPYVAVAERGKDAADTFLHSMGRLWSLGLKPAIPKSAGAFTLPDLPTYPWHYDSSH